MDLLLILKSDAASEQIIQFDPALVIIFRVAEKRSGLCR